MGFLHDPRYHRLRQAAAIAAALLFMVVVAAIAAVSSSSSGGVAAKSGRATSSPSAPAFHDPTNGAVAEAIQVALAHDGYSYRATNNPLPTINDDYSEGTAYIWVDGGDQVNIVNNGLRFIRIGAESCLFHPAISGVAFAVAYDAAVGCTNDGLTWGHEQIDLSENLRQMFGRVTVTGNRTVKADFAQLGTPIPQTSVPDATQLQRAGYRVSGTQEMDGLIQ